VTVKPGLVSSDANTADLELLRQIQRGQPSAFHQLVDRYADYLHRVARTLTGNATDAEDAVQETFAGAFRSAGSFREQASVKTWLLRILVRQCARCHRGRQRQVVLRISDAEPSLLERDGLSVAATQTQVDVRLDLDEMLQAMTPEHREVIVLREMEQLSYEEMAAALGIPRGTVESRLFRARQEFRARFSDYL
jgi:RNA polymerase sigma-70 factor, ECF subfamily